jgi:hypothetical protein
MNPLICIGLAAFFIGLIASRILSERALRLLTPDEKLRLLDSASFSRLRAFGSIPLVFIVGIFFSITSCPPQFVLPAFFGAWALLGGFITWQHFFVQRHLRELSISGTYRAAYSRALWASRAGFIALFAFSAIAIFQ